MHLTRIDLNSWIVQMAGQTVLIDPWLVDPLVFYGWPWLFTASHITPPVFTPETLPPIDLILISQGLDDHCHRPTLRALDHDLPVVGSPTAAKVVQRLGYPQVTPLLPWQTHRQGQLAMTAVPGAILQGQRENGYMLQDLSTGTTLYYEPHLFDPTLGIEQHFSQIEGAIAPVVGQIFPGLGTVIMGPEQAITLVTTLKPKFFVPTSVGNIQTRGLLTTLIQSVGSVAEFRQRLIDSGATTQLLTPEPGETLDLRSWERKAMPH
ncbi:hypothetical protein DO97_14255 [Neosynechococcus sphagnicola sy1]|uniref:Zn-dependent hydrolase n=1 Tax=Neosynechococcus sphagnicola sy1 TaxID=1497020 RepID=A0A098TH57_9CYAN|nr:MBL fold metallo-hydrolase [Neosynechococcus sphagnicola]KGF71920.1 hypothetical protein DO97_14255 [Neosynechococcus sphagnicola sy1]